MDRPNGADNGFALNSLPQRVGLLWGRVRRVYQNLFRRSSVRESLSRREGKCLRCGACCRMGVPCRHLAYEDGLAACLLYDRRLSPNCRNFPMSPRDLADRDLVLPDRPCGYRFVADGQRED